MEPDAPLHDPSSGSLTESDQARQMQESLIAAQVGTWEIDLGSGAVRRSASCDLIFGFEPDDRPRSLSDYLDRIHPADRARAQEAVRRATEEQGEHFMEFRVIRTDGAERWTAVRGTAARDAYGEPVRLVGAILDVTEQHAAEQAHREGEARLALALDAGQLATWDWFVDEDRVVWSAQMYRLHGYAPGAVEPSHARWLSHIHPDDRPGVEEALRRSMEGAAHYAIEFRLIPAGGGPERWIEARGRFYYDEDGTPHHLTGVASDVTERRRADRDRALLAAIVASSDDAIISKTLDGILTSWNAGAERILGYTADEVLGQSVLTLIPPDRRDEENLILSRLRRGEPVEHFETVRLAKGGRPLDVSLTISPIRDRDGRIVGASKILRDITASKRAEAALRESEAQFRQLAEALPDIAYTLPSDGRPDYVNARWAEYTGLSAQESSLEALSAALHPDDYEHAAAAWARAKAAGEPMEVEFRLRRHDGAYHWFLTRVVPVLDADGRAVRWFGTSIDIHTQKAAEAELAERVAERTAELARSNEALDQFAYVASHDLKAPLRGIDNLASWIAEDAGHLLPEESRRHLDLLQGRVQRMERLLSDLLAYSRAGREESAPEEVDPAALVRDVADLLGGPPGIEVVVEAMPTLVTPRAPLEMIFRNLIGNAFKHHDRPEGRVRVYAHDTGDFLTFTVEDDGPGIPARYHERIFGLFQTLRPRDEVEGSGMGLAVVKKAVASRGGTIRVASAEGRGAAFAFTWPKHV